MPNFLLSRMSAMAASTLASLAFSGAVAAQATITVGPGPVIGTDSGGNTYFEEFLDWRPGDVKALSPVGAVASGRYNFNDGQDNSRDLQAFYFRDEGSRVFFRIDLFDLALGAENSSLDFYIAINTGSTTAGVATFLPDFTDVQVSESPSGVVGGWNLCLAMYSNPFWAIYDSSYNRMAERNNGAPTGPWASAFVGHNNGPYYNRELDAVELGIEKALLFDRGWNGRTPLKFWVATTRDGTNNGPGEITGGSGATSDVTDTFKDPGRGFDDGVINGFISSTDTVGRAKFASIAHANQSVNKAADVVTHVYEPNSFNTGFVRALDTHEIFRIPLNMHLSGSLITALLWAETPKGNAVELRQDGPLFLARIARMIDPSRSAVPSSLIGGVYSEHIMPYFEGPINRISMDLFEELSLKVFGVGAADMKVMHIPERVVRSQAIPTPPGPLTGLTFADIAATTYSAAYIDEVTHYHHWFDSSNTQWTGNGGGFDAPPQHKIQKINGVYNFLINDREDQGKFANDDEGAKLDMRFVLGDKALQTDQAQITVVFDDWEALAGKSFDPTGGALIPNNNQMQYQRSMRWIANKQWVEVVNLKDVLDRATDPSHPQYDPNWVIDRGFRDNLPIETYEWLKQATEGSYHNWYYNSNNSVMGNEQDFYNLVPVLLGRQGDYRIRRNSSNVPLTNFIQAVPLAQRSQEANAQDAAMGAVFLPSGKRMGDLNTSNTILHDAYVDIVTAPDNPLRRLGLFQYSAMIYETAWHEEDNGNYQNNTFQNPFPNPDTTWDGLNEWCARLGNHVRDVGYLAYAARWAEDVRTGSQGPASSVHALDLDQDGQDEWVLRNNRAMAIFQRHGGRMLHAFHYHPTAGPISVIGSPVSNPSEPGEEERTGNQANRCSALKEVNGGIYADMLYTAQPGVPNASSIRFVSADGLVQKTVTLPANREQFEVEYVENVSGPLFVRVGASPNNLDLIKTGQASLSTQLLPGQHYAVLHTSGTRGGVWVTLNGGATLNPTPSFAGYRNRNISLTEEIEVSGSGTFRFAIAFAPPVTGASAEIEVLGTDGSTIPNGATTISSANGTDFGSVLVGSPAVDRLFFVFNGGTAPLSLDGNPAVVRVTPGANTAAGEITVATQPGTSVEPSFANQFSIRFNPTTAGSKSAVITLVPLNVSGVPAYTFTVGGTATVPPPPAGIGVTGNSISIVNGDTTPSTLDGTDFGSIQLGAAAVNRTFVISNPGGTALNLNPTPAVVRIAPGANTAASEISVTSQAAATVAPGGTSPFTLRFNPATAGLKSATVTIVPTNVPGVTSYTFVVGGTATAPPVPANITVTGNGQAITNGSVTASAANGTDFGTVFANEPREQTFVITNPSPDLPLAISSTLLEAGATDVFTLVQEPSGNVAPGGVTQARVRFAPNANGLRQVSFVITSNAAAPNNSFRFLIQGTGVVSGSFTPRLTNPFPSAAGWSPIGQLPPLFTSAFGSRQHDAVNTALAVTVAPNPRGRVIGWVEDPDNDLRYADIGPGNFVRAKFSMFYSGPGDSASATLFNRVPNFRLALRMRGMVQTVLEVNHNPEIAGSPAQAFVTRELGPSKNPAAPSVYRVDLDPVDVPYFTNSTTEGVQRAFEAVMTEPKDYSFVEGTLALTDSSIGTYPALSDAVTPVKTWASGGTAGAADFDNPTVVTGGLSLTVADLLRYLGGPSPADYYNPAVLNAGFDTAPATITRSTAGVTANTAGLATTRVAAMTANLLGGVFGDTPATRLRVEPGRLYRVSARVFHGGPSDTTPFTRLGVRTAGFGWNQTLELLGARGLPAATGTRPGLAQMLPGTGNQVPGTTGDGTVYNLLLGTPLHPQIRADVAGTIAAKFPNLSAQPGPGDPATGAGSPPDGSLRNVNLAFTVIDSLSPASATATDPAEVANNLRLNRVEIRVYPDVVD